MNLNLEDPGELGLCLAEQERPLTAPPTVPVILRLELVVLDTAHYRLPLLCGLRKSSRDSVSVVVHGVARHFGLDGSAKSLHCRVRAPGLVVARLLPQVVVLEGLLRPGVSESPRAQ